MLHRTKPVPLETPNASTRIPTGSTLSPFTPLCSAAVAPPSTTSLPSLHYFPASLLSLHYFNAVTTYLTPTYSTKTNGLLCGVAHGWERAPPCRPLLPVQRSRCSTASLTSAHAPLLHTVTAYLTPHTTQNGSWIDGGVHFTLGVGFNFWTFSDVIQCQRPKHSQSHDSTFHITYQRIQTQRGDALQVCPGQF